MLPIYFHFLIWLLENFNYLHYISIGYCCILQNFDISCLLMFSPILFHLKIDFLYLFIFIFVRFQGKAKINGCIHSVMFNWKSCVSFSQSSSCLYLWSYHFVSCHLPSGTDKWVINTSFWNTLGSFKLSCLCFLCILSLKYPSNSSHLFA